MARNYEQYKDEVANEIKNVLGNMSCQPILFVGSGISKRYFEGPNWEELLSKMASDCPLINKEFGYYKQSTTTMAEIGTAFSSLYRDWAWGDGRKKFRSELFKPDTHKDIYIKDRISDYLKQITPTSLSTIKPNQAKKELTALQNIRPHAIITTNYDQFLEMLFPEYEPIIGQQILRQNFVSVGEIFKIHGCCSKPESLVLTTEDYKIFTERKKYLSAKLFTYFAEHPLLFMGYSAEDDNIKNILADIDELLAEPNELIKNIFILNWAPNIQESDYPARERIINVGKHRNVRINNITSDSFEWIFDAFSTKSTIEQISPKILRSLLARAFYLFRNDIPTRTIEFQYDSLKHAAEKDGVFEKLLGITTSGATNINISHPYSLTEVGKKIGFPSWHGAKKLLDRIVAEKKVNVTKSDNQYHVRVKTGEHSASGKYSEHLIDLLKAVKSGKEYSVDIKKVA